MTSFYGASRNLLPHQNTKANSEAESYLNSLPARRRGRATIASVTTFLIAAILLAAYAYANEKMESKAETDPSTINLTAVRNETNKICRQEEKTSHQILIWSGIALLSVVLGTFLHCLSFVFEEVFHLKSHYNGKMTEMSKACFGGVSWLAVTFFIIISTVNISISLRQDQFETKYLLALLFGIGLMPLTMQYLFNPKKSDVLISTILEEKETRPGQILAWLYYFIYLKNELPIFTSMCFTSHSITKAGPATHDLPLLLSEKLILLVSTDCVTIDELQQLDDKITKVKEIFHGGYTFPVYELAYEGIKHRFVIKSVTQPLRALYQMSYRSSVKAVHNGELHREVKFFYKTLSDILKMSLLDGECYKKCILVPIPGSARSFQNGTLVDLIMHQVKQV